MLFGLGYGLALNRNLKIGVIVTLTGIDFLQIIWYSHIEFSPTIVIYIFTYECGKPNRPTQVARWFSIGERWLVNWNRRGVLSALSFTDSGVCYSERAWLMKATNVVEGKRRSVD